MELPPCRARAFRTVRVVGGCTTGLRSHRVAGMADQNNDPSRKETRTRKAIYEPHGSRQTLSATGFPPCGSVDADPRQGSKRLGSSLVPGPKRRTSLHKGYEAERGSDSAFASGSAGMLQCKNHEVRCKVRPAGRPARGVVFVLNAGPLAAALASGFRLSPGRRRAGAPRAPGRRRARGRGSGGAQTDHGH